MAKIVSSLGEGPKTMKHIVEKYSDFSLLAIKGYPVAKKVEQILNTTNEASELALFIVLHLAMSG